MKRIAWAVCAAVCGLLAATGLTRAQSASVPAGTTPSRTGYVAVDSSRLFYEECGAERHGSPSLVLVHDGMMGAASWDLIWPTLCARAHVVRYDRRGVGRSTGPKVEFSQVADLDALLTDRGIARVTVVGSSAGGGLSLEYALAHPERVERLVLLGPVVNGIGFSQHFIQREHRVVRYDLRGFGRSADRDGPFQAHEDLRALLDTLHIRRASLVGLSGGGRIAIDFALTYPDRVDRLVLAAPGLSGWEYRDRGDTTYFAEARRARDRRDTAGLGIAWLGSAYMRPAMEHPELVTPLREMAGANGKAWLSLLTRGDVERVLAPPALARTATLRVPTLLVIGSRDTGDMQAIADTLTATVPGIRRVTFVGAGHMTNMEQPARFTDVIRAFLGR